MAAVIPFGTGQPEKYLHAPAGLGGGGWDWTGAFGVFTGVPVGPSSFITAAHIGQSVGQTFTWRGQAFRAVSFETDSQSDLQLWHVCGEFPGFAPRVTSDLGRDEGIVVIGRGTARGAEIMVDRGNGPELGGWTWGVNNGAQRWGTNTVDAVADGLDIGLYGPVVTFDFDGDAGDDECTVSVGDSGGPVWVQRSGQWQLAAVNFATDSEYRTDPEAPTQQGAIFDFRGLYRQASPGSWDIEPANGDGPAPAVSFSTRVWPRRQWIDSVIQRAPGPASLMVSTNLASGFGSASGATHDPVRREFRVPMSPSASFFRVTGPAGPQLRDIRVEGSRVVIRYD
jgi:hypothetical protein